MFFVLKGLCCSCPLFCSTCCVFHVGVSSLLRYKVRFAWGGDIAGQNICRDAEEGFPVMEALNSLQGLDFFLNVGDAIYGESQLLCSSSCLGNTEDKQSTQRHQCQRIPRRSLVTEGRLKLADSDRDLLRILRSGQVESGVWLFYIDVEKIRCDGQLDNPDMAGPKILLWLLCQPTCL